MKLTKGHKQNDAEALGRAVILAEKQVQVYKWLVDIRGRP